MIRASALAVLIYLAVLPGAACAQSIAKQIDQSWNIGTVSEDDPDDLTILKSKVAQSYLGTVINIEFFARHFTQRMFVRIGCEVYNHQGDSLGKFARDFGSGLPYRPLSFIAQSFQRPALLLPPSPEADHAVCRFAKAGDPVPVVDLDEVEARLLTTHELHFINHSAFHIALVKFDCITLDGKTVWHLSSSGLGLSPDYSSPRQAIPHGPMRSCSVTGAEAAH